MSDAKNTERPAAEAVVSNATAVKKSQLKKFGDAMIKENFHNVVDRVLYDICIPALKETIVDGIHKGLEMWLIGTVSTGRDARRRGNIVSYDQYYEDRRRDSRPTRRPIRSTFDIDDISFDSRVDAEKVRDKIFETLDEYGSIRVSDVWGFCGWDSEYTYNKYGWTKADLRIIPISYSRGAYVLELPTPRALD